MSKSQFQALSNHYHDRANEIGLQISNLAWYGKSVPKQMKADYAALWNKKNDLMNRSFKVQS